METATIKSALRLDENIEVIAQIFALQIVCNNEAFDKVCKEGGTLTSTVYDSILDSSEETLASILDMMDSRTDEFALLWYRCRTELTNWGIPKLVGDVIVRDIIKCKSIKKIMSKYVLNAVKDGAKRNTELDYVSVYRLMSDVVNRMYTVVRIFKLSGLHKLCSVSKIA